MRLKVRLSGRVVDWLRANPGDAPAFFERIAEVRSNALALLRHTESTTTPESRYMCRHLRFGAGCFAVLEWGQAASRIRVVICDRLNPSDRPEPPPA